MAVVLKSIINGSLNLKTEGFDYQPDGYVCELLFNEGYIKVNQFLSDQGTQNARAGQKEKKPRSHEDQLISLMLCSGQHLFTLQKYSDLRHCVSPTFI